MLIGITGSIGSGKSRVLRKLADLLGASIFNADQECRTLMEKGGEGYRRFVSLYGDSFLDREGGIDRGKLRRELYDDEELKRALESILHPLVRDALTHERKSSAGRGSRIIAAEIPLLFETGWQDEFDLVVLVSAPESLLIERVLDRDGGAAEDVLSILAAQMSDSEKRKLADVVIDNSNDWNETEKQLKDLVLMVRNLAV